MVGARVLVRLAGVVVVLGAIAQSPASTAFAKGGGGFDGDGGGAGTPGAGAGAGAAGGTGAVDEKGVPNSAPRIAPGSIPGTGAPSEPTRSPASPATSR